jgi:hypothetical protein
MPLKLGFAVNGGPDGMPFLVLDRDGNPMVDSETGLILHFDTREEAEAFRKANRGARVMEVPFLPE